jgi:hypothetical protein
MSVATEFAAGSALLIACALVHLAVLMRVVATYRAPPPGHGEMRFRMRHFSAIAKLFIAIAMSHTVQVCIWAFVLLWIGALPQVEESIYFAMVTYTTLGYGDVVLTPEFRIFGAMAAMTGILCFGLSTAVLVGYFAGLISESKA